MNDIINKLNEVELLINNLENQKNELKNQLIEELKKTETKNYRTDKALYSLVTKSNDKFNEAKFKDENAEIYNKYLKTKVSFDITTFKKKEKELTEKYMEKGEITYQLMIKENKVEQEHKIENKEVKEIDL